MRLNSVQVFGRQRLGFYVSCTCRGRLIGLANRCFRTVQRTHCAHIDGTCDAGNAAEQTETHAAPLIEQISVDDILVNEVIHRRQPLGGGPPQAPLAIHSRKLAGVSGKVFVGGVGTPIICFLANGKI
jgi:hypothetical protein